MGNAKALVVKPISRDSACEVVRRIHYSGKIVNNSTLHLGVFYRGRLEGAIQFGSPIDRRKVLPLVNGSEWNQMLELNRMAFSEALPRNSESRAMAVAFRMLRKHRPDIKWLLSFADATQCGDGTIYRAAGFVLTAIVPNKQMIRMADGRVVARKTLDNPQHTGADGCFGSRVALDAGGEYLVGHQLRYVYFLDRSWRDRLTVPVIPFSEIPPGARMYRGQRAGPAGDFGDHPEKGGSSPTPALHEDPDAP